MRPSREFGLAHGDTSQPLIMNDRTPFCKMFVQQTRRTTVRTVAGPSISERQSCFIEIQIVS